MPQQVNPDGTVQVAPPTQSAFAPQPVQTAPPVQAPQPVQSQGSDPSFAGAIMALIHGLASSFAPKAITQRKPAVNNEVDRQSGDLGNQF